LIGLTYGFFDERGLDEFAMAKLPYVDQEHLWNGRVEALFRAAMRDAGPAARENAVGDQATDTSCSISNFSDIDTPPMARIDASTANGFRYLINGVRRP
jgi:hypothetical protein